MNVKLTDQIFKWWVSYFFKKLKDDKGKLFKVLMPIAFCHDERWNGTQAGGSSR